MPELVFEELPEIWNAHEPTERSSGSVQLVGEGPAKKGLGPFVSDEGLGAFRCASQVLLQRRVRRQL